LKKLLLLLSLFIISTASFAGQNITGNLYVTGNVGIGTSVPAGKIDIPGSFTGFRLLVDSFGNVGIGTVSPREPLEINSNGTNIPLILLQSSGSNLGRIGAATYTYNNAVSGDFGITSSGKRIFIGSIQTPTVFTTDGNVGIGTAAPRAQLDVSGTLAPASPFIVTSLGNVGVGTVTPGQALDVGGTVRAVAYKFQDGTTQTTAATSALWAVQNTTDESLAGGNVGIGTTITGGAALSVMNGNVGIGTWVPRATLEVAGTLASAPGLIVFPSGNIGIGTVLPQYILDVNGSFHTNGAVQLDSNIGFAGTKGLLWGGGSKLFEQTAASGGADRMLYTPNGSDFEVLNKGGSGFVAIIKYNQFSVYTGATDTSTYEQLRINSAGYIGIGTTTPQTRLAITSGNVGIGTWTAAGGNLIVNGGGNVGIGSAWPGQALDVGGTVRAVNFQSTGAPTDGTVVCWCSTGRLGKCVTLVGVACTSCVCL
jgi:hypothetical protein